MEGRNKRTLTICALAGAVGALCIFLILGVVGYWYLEPAFISLQEASAKNICQSYDEGIYCFFADVWDDGTYLATITGFYTALITILLGLIALVGAFSFVVIRTNALGHTEDYVDSVLEQPHMQHIFESKIAAAVDQNFEASKKYTELMNRLDAMEVAIEELGGEVSGTITKGDK